MRSGQTLLVANSILWFFFFTKLQKIRFFEKGVSKTMKDFFFHEMTEFQKNKFLEGLNKSFSAKRKKSIYLVRKNTIEKTKTNRKRGETTKEMEQKQFCKKG